MITSPAFAQKKYAVLGLARSGLTAVESLVASGAEVLAWDNRPEAREAISDKVQIGDLLTTDLEGYAGIVVSPGVPLNRHPITEKSRESGVPIIGDIELFAQARPALPPHKVVGITGTNGKSTTTALVHHILRTASIPTTMAGNIGYPILSQDPLVAGGVYVLELSSYQIDLTHSLDCDVAVLLNITPDHLDRYESVEHYGRSKLRLFAMQNAGSHRIVLEHGFVGDTPVGDLLDEVLVPRTVEHHPVVGITADTDASIVLGQAAWKGRIFSRQSDWPSLQGPHNAQNVAAAISVCVGGLGIDPGVVGQALGTYPGLPHRMERVADRNGVLFINDSKATNPEAVAPALAAFDAVHWIVGGLPKTDSLGPCESQLDHVRAAYTIGEAGPMFARLLQGKVPVSQCELLVEAVQCASRAASPGEVVLLSPACASFDQFRDYEARGDAFRAAVGALG